MRRRAPYALSFADPTIEEAFWASFAERMRAYLQVGAVLLPVLLTSFGVLDLLLAPERYRAVWLVRAGLVVSQAAFAPVYFLERFRPLLARRLQEVMLAQAVLAMLGLLAVGYLLASDPTSLPLHIGSMGMQVALAFLYGLSRLRTRYAVPIGVIGTASAIVVLAGHPARSLEIAGVALFYALATNATGAWICWTLESVARRTFEAGRRIELERKRSEALLHNVLPADIVARLQARESRPAFADRHDDVTVVLADLVGFTPLAESLPLEDIAGLLDQMFSAFDERCEARGLTKIKTLGDGWLACAGVPVALADHADVAADLALDLLDAAERVRQATGATVTLRVGMFSGPVVAGVIGRQRFAYDLWGDAVTGAMALEQSSQPGRIHLPRHTADKLSPRFLWDEDGESSAWLQGRTAAQAALG